MVIIMFLWIGNGAVLKSSSQWQLKEFWKLDNSGHELFIMPCIERSAKVKVKYKGYIFQKMAVNGATHLVFKILLIAIDWNFLEMQH